MKYAVGIVTYYPDRERLLENISAIAANSGAGHVIIVDNGSSDTSIIDELTINIKDKLIVKNNSNLGIARALNQICQEAIALGYEWVLTLDQDSVLQPSTLEEYALYSCQPDIGIICPRIEDRNMGRQYARTDCGTEYIQKCITSGNLVRLNVWATVGGFTEELFIDGVDFDFCMKVCNSGYKILRTNNVYLTQEVGHGRAIPLPFHHQISIGNHSPIRMYYITRNYLYLGKKYKQSWQWILEVGKRIFIVLCFEKNRRLKLHYIMTGLKHFHRGLMGPLFNPVKI